MSKEETNGYVSAGSTVRVLFNPGPESALYAAENSYVEEELSEKSIRPILNVHPVGFRGERLQTYLLYSLVRNQRKMLISWRVTPQPGVPPSEAGAAVAAESSTST